MLYLLGALGGGVALCCIYEVHWVVVLLCDVFIRCIGWWCCSVMYLLGALGGGVALCCIY